MPEAQPSLSEEKTIPIEDTGESIDIELQETEDKDNSVETPVKEEVQVDSEHEEYSSGVKKRINDLTKKWREEERQKEAAIQFAESAKKRNQELEKKVSSLDDSYIEEVAQKVDIQEVNLKRDLAAAHQNQDFDKVAEIQTALSDNSVQKSRVLSLKKQTEQKASEVTTETPKEFKEQVQPQQPRPQPSQKAKDWANKNSWFGQGEGKDEVMTFATWGIHTNLVNEGFNPESDEYYNEINNRLTTYFPDKIGKTNSNSSQANNRIVQTVAGANTTRTGGKSGRRTVKLTPSQVSIAKKLGVPLDEYAKFVKE
tara:strand:- start:2637 stop:3572 length:936 start_codon:yes stop_codon:yes gene_type:complete